MDTVDVEAEVDKAIELACQQLRESLVELGDDIQEDGVGFWKAEKRFSKAIIAFACRVLPALLSLYDHGAKYVEYNGDIWRRGTEKKAKTYYSIWGEIEVERWVYLKRGEAGGRQLVPLEHQAGLLDGEWTPHCAESIGRMVQSVPSREARRNMEVVGLLPYSRSSFDRVAGLVGERWEDERHDLEDELIQSVEIPDQARGISVAYDRVRLEMDETELDPDQWPNGRKQPRIIEGRMAYCATVTLHDVEGEPLWTKRYGRVSDQPPDADVPGAGEFEIRQQVRWDVDCLLERAPRLKARKVALSDGGPELERIIDQDFPEWTRLCDMRHLTSYLADALEAEGLTDEQRAEQLRAWTGRLKYHSRGVEVIEEYLADRRDIEEVDEALTYIENRRERMRYKKAVMKGLPIASGHVEATCKSLFQVRMRRSGQRWTKSGAQEVLSLRSLALSDVWSKGMSALMSRAVDDGIERADELCDAYAA